MNIAQSPNINHLWAHLIIEELIRTGVDYFCISPGSRSSPLTTAVALNSKAQSFIHFDERGTAYHALGYISASKRPCVLICTSGTAAANYYPAVIEAFKKKLPLIVLTADRPPELRYSGAEQTIDQVGLFGRYVRWEFDIPCPTKDMKPAFLLTTIDQALHRAKGSPPGPVHLNCMYREPLAPIKTQSNFQDYVKELTQWETDNKPYTQYIPSDQVLPDHKKKEISTIINEIKNGLIVVGKLSSPAEQKAVIKLSEKLNWPVFPDIVSGLRLGVPYPNVIPYFDQILLSEKFVENFPFDGVIHIGGRMTSKRWYTTVENISLKHYIMVLNHPLRNDPIHKVSLRIEANILNFCEAIMPHLMVRHDKNRLLELQSACLKIERQIEAHLTEIKQLSEPLVARLISECILPNHGLFLASSMPIRDMDMYAYHAKNMVTVGANRGASGIDGTIATAVGFAVGLNQVTTLFIGDLALLHDLNSLTMLRQLAQPLIIVVLNNNGGGIFSFLPISEFGDIFEQYFGTPHHLIFSQAAKMFGLNYINPQTQEEFIAGYKEALKGQTSTLIEVMTNRAENANLHQVLQKSIRSTLNKHFQTIFHPKPSVFLQSK